MTSSRVLSCFMIGAMVLGSSVLFTACGPGEEKVIEETSDELEEATDYAAEEVDMTFGEGEEQAPAEEPTSEEAAPPSDGEPEAGSDESEKPEPPMQN